VCATTANGSKLKFNTSNHNGVILMELADHDLVIAIVDYEITESLLDKAEEVGVTGSTIIPGRGRSFKAYCCLEKGVYWGC
jgi:hypothetical protein